MKKPTLFRKELLLRRDQIDTPQKIQALWRELVDRTGIREVDPDNGLVVDIQDHLFGDEVSVTFSAYIDNPWRFGWTPGNTRG